VREQQPRSCGLTDVRSDSRLLQGRDPEHVHGRAGRTGPGWQKLGQRGLGRGAPEDGAEQKARMICSIKVRSRFRSGWFWARAKFHSYIKSPTWFGLVWMDRCLGNQSSPDQLRNWFHGETWDWKAAGKTGRQLIVSKGIGTAVCAAMQLHSAVRLAGRCAGSGRLAQRGWNSATTHTAQTP